MSGASVLLAGASGKHMSQSGAEAATGAEDAADAEAPADAEDAAGVEAVTGAKTAAGAETAAAMDAATPAVGREPPPLPGNASPMPRADVAGSIAAVGANAPPDTADRLVPFNGAVGVAVAVVGAVVARGVVGAIVVAGVVVADVVVAGAAVCADAADAVSIMRATERGNRPIMRASVMVAA